MTFVKAGNYLFNWLTPYKRLKLRRWVYGLVALMLTILISIGTTVNQDAIATNSVADVNSDTSAATERILNFNSDIVVYQNASLKVTETIDVQAQGDQNQARDLS